VRPAGALFRDRAEAGRRLGAALERLGLRSPIVLGLARGGVLVAVEVARVLAAPLDVVVVRKVGVPFQPELAMGAVGEEGVVVVDREIVSAAGVTEEELASREREALGEAAGLAERLRGARAPYPLVGRDVIVVDDGLATGASAVAACGVARGRGARSVTVAAPVCSGEARTLVSRAADEVVCLLEPPNFLAVGYWYEDFSQVPEALVVEVLERRAAELAEGAPPG
jgi:putative phosphoribosyl transferase